MEIDRAAKLQSQLCCSIGYHPSKLVKRWQKLCLSRKDKQGEKAGLISHISQVGKTEQNFSCILQSKALRDLSFDAIAAKISNANHQLVAY